MKVEARLCARADQRASKNEKSQRLTTVNVLFSFLRGSPPELIPHSKHWSVSRHTGTPQLVVCHWRGQEVCAVLQETAAFSMPAIVLHPCLHDLPPSVLNPHISCTRLPVLLLLLCCCRKSVLTAEREIDLSHVGFKTHRTQENVNGGG